MNNILNVKLSFNHEKKIATNGPKNLKKSKNVTSKKIDSLINDLIRIKSFFESDGILIKDILFDSYYNDIICKSGRIQKLFNSSGDFSEFIVGARFTDDEEGEEKHIITYYVTRDMLGKALERLDDAKKLIDEQLGGIATASNFDSNNQDIDYGRYKTPKSVIRDVIIDCSVLDKFDIPSAASYLDKDRVIVTFFETELRLDNLLHELGIDRRDLCEKVGKSTLSVSKEAYRILLEKVPYMISMTTSDISEIEPQNPIILSNEKINIPSPTSEPVIGVIDTMFDEKVYFHEWVEYIETLNEVEKYTLVKDYYNHGTAVSSIIVDGPRLNPDLEDGCGRFRVRHFGVCPGIINPSSLIKKIRKIVSENTDIHVWNLSLGTEEEVSKNFITFDAAELDQLHKEYNIIFVISGTNDKDRRSQKDPYKRIGSPADSLNSLVVNSVRKDGSPAIYSRNGKVLSFFNKPDVSYYGGDFDERIRAYTNKGLESVFGTSFAAPWIARKLCYLIDVMGFSREVAKALIIDSAAGWEYKQENYRYQNIIGYGVVPKRITSILESDNSEIKFVIQGISNSYYTSNYGIPVPKDEEVVNYIARVTMCYFPECNRLQGVDYTQRELSIRFGRIMNNKINDINENTQDDEDSYNNERKSRKEFRKWENTKFISNIFKPNKIKSLKVYNDGLWGISIASKERQEIAKKNNLSFGVVITLKHTKGLNKINDFIHACLLRGYIVNEVKVENQLELYNKAQEEISFD